MRKNFAFNLGLTLFLFLMVLPFSAGATIFPFNSPGGETGDYFGTAVAVDGNYAIFGATGAGDENGGRAYIYKHDGTGWQFLQELNPGDLDGENLDGGDLFGQAVDISGDYAIVGAPGDDTQGGDAGRAYVFKRNGSDQWNLVATNVLPVAGSAGGNFGWSVAIHSMAATEAYAVAGAPEDSVNGKTQSGSAYFYSISNTSISSEEIRLYPLDGTDDDKFGRAVSLSRTGDGRIFAVIGAEGALTGNDSDAGAACVYERTSTGWGFVSPRLTASDYEAGAFFGASVSIDGDYAIIGAPFEDEGSTTPDSGSAYIFRWNGSEWSQTQKLTVEDGNDYDFFGVSVSISGDYAIVGADGKDPSGAAYVFWFNGSEWELLKTIIDSNGTQLGSAVSVYSDGTDVFTVIGAPESSTGSALIDDSAGDGNDLNFAPSISHIENQQVLIGTSELSIPVTITDDGLVVSAGVESQPTGTIISNAVLTGTGENRQIDITLNTTQSGSADITVTAEDDAGATNQMTFTLTVSDPPTISGLPEEVIINENESTDVIDFTVTDDTPASELDISAASSDSVLVPSSGIALDEENTTISITPAADRTGTATITITVEDTTNGDVSTASFLLIVNGGPSITGISPTDPSTEEDTTSGTITVTVQDDEGGSLRLTAKSQDTALVANGENDTPFFDQTEPSVAPGTPVDFTFEITPEPNANGTASIVVTAIDGAGGQSSQTFDFLITPVADVPVIDDIILSTTSESLVDGIDDFVSIPEDTQTPRIDIQVSHGDGEILTVLVDAGNSSTTLNGMSTDSTNVGTTPNSISTVSLILTPPANFVGSELITVTATDGTNQVTETFQLDVTDVNDRPIIHNISDGGTSIIDSILTIDEDGQTNLLDIIVSDPDGGTLTVSVESSNTTLLPMGTDGNIKLGQDEVTRNQITDEIETLPGVQETVNLQLIPKANQSGESVITVTVTDQDASNPLEASDSFTLEVLPQNDPPTVHIPDSERTIDEDTSLTLDITVEDIDGDTPLTLSAASDNTDLIPNQNITFSGTGSTRKMTITPAPDANSQNTGRDALITVTVSDPANATGTDFINIIVSPVPDAPIIIDLQDETIEEGQELKTNFNILDIDSDNLKITVSESTQPGLIESMNIPESYSRFGNDFFVRVTPGQTTPITLEATPKEGVSGQTQIQITISDGDAASADAEDFSLVTILFVNDPPVIEDIDIIYEIEEDETLVLTYDDPATDTLECDPSVQNCINICDLDSDFLKLSLHADDSTLFPDQNIDISDGLSDFGTFYIVSLKDETGCKHPNKDLELRFVPAENLSGFSDITLQVEDSHGGITTHTFTIFVTSVEDPPTISGAPPLTAFIGEEYTFTPGASDPDTGDDTFLFDLERTDGEVLPDWIHFDPATGTITGTPPTETEIGTQIGLKITVTNDPPETDAQGQTLLDTLEFTLTIDKNIGLPSISPIDEQSTNEDTRLDVPFTITESNGDPVLITVNSSKPDLVPTSRITILGDGVSANNQTPEDNDYILDHEGGTSNLFIRLNPLPDANSDIHGISLIQITAEDFDGSAEPERFDFEVIAQPDAPKLLDGEQAFPFNLGYKMDENTVDKNTMLTLSTALPVTPSDHQDRPVDFRVKDVDRDILTVSAFSDNQTLIPDANIKIFERGQEPGFEPFWIVTLDDESEALMDMTITPALHQFGQTIITVEVNDSDGLKTQARFLVTVGNVQDAPEIVSVSVPSEPIPEEGQTSIPFTVRDLDGDILTLKAVELDENNKPVEEDGLFSTISITGTGVSYDDQGNALIEVDPGVETSLNLNLTGTLNRTGTANIRLTVSDESASDESTFPITVFGVNDPPTIEAIPNYYINEDKATDPPPPTPTLPVPITLDDPDGDSLEISVTSGNQDIVKDSAFFLSIGDNQFALPQTITSEQYSNEDIHLDLTPVKYANGTVKITVTVNDGTANPVSREFDLTVNPIPNSPIISTITDKTMNEDDNPPTINPIDFTVKDPDGGTLSLFVQSFDDDIVPNNPENLSISGPSGNIAADFDGDTFVRYSVDVEPGVEVPLSFNILPAENQFGSVTIRLTVNDETIFPTNPEQNQYTEFLLTINSVNDPPTVSGIIGPEYMLVHDTTIIPFQVTDVEPIQDPSSFPKIRAYAANGAVIPDSNIDWRKVSGSNYELLITSNDEGTEEIHIEATDEEGATSEDFFFDLIVKQSGFEILDIEPRTVNEDETREVEFTVIYDGDPSALSFSAFSDNTDLIANDSFNIRPDVDDDPSDLKHPYLITIKPRPDAPYDATASASVGIDIRAETTQFTANTQLDVTIIPKPDSPEVSDIGPQHTFENVPIVVEFQVGDADGDDLVVSVTSSNQTIVPDQNIDLAPGETNSRVVTTDPRLPTDMSTTITPAMNQTGTVTITVSASDGDVHDPPVVPTTFELKIDPSGTPFFSAIEPIVAIVNEPIGILFTVTDVDGGLLELDKWSTDTTVIPDSNIIITQNGAVVTEVNSEAGVPVNLGLTLTAKSADTATINLEAKDPSGKVGTVSFDLIARAVRAGDVNNNGTVDLTDAILALKVLSGMSPTGVDSRADVNNDDRIGLPEVIYILQYVAEMR
ncbi:MAG: Ig-like domain-containing protein [Thermodesulfobacteriota bacterium]